MLYLQCNIDCIANQLDTTNTLIKIIKEKNGSKNFAHMPISPHGQGVKRE